MPLSVEDTARLQAYTAKVYAGKETLEDLKDAVRIMRSGRVSAQIASTKSKTTKAAAAKPVDAGAVLDGLMNMADSIRKGDH